MKTKAERFWEFVDLDGPYFSQLGSRCWTWTGGNNGNGYGKFRGHYTHRYAYELLIGLIAPGLVSDHLCRNRGCCNPAHIELVTSRENTLRGISKIAREAQQTHCIHGHPLWGENLIKRRSGARCCRICKNLRRRGYRLLKKYDYYMGREKLTGHFTPPAGTQEQNLCAPLA